MAPVRKKLAVLVLLAVVAVAGVYAYRHVVERPSAKPTELTLYGNIDIREVDLGFNDAGRVATMRVDEGDVVRKGELLATLDASRYQAEVEATKARIAAQQAVLDRLVAGTRPEEIAKARAEVEAVSASLVNARTRLARTEKLATESFASMQQLDDDRRQVDTLSAQLDAARQVLALAIQGPRKEDIAQARAELAAEQAALALAQEHLKDTRLYAMEDGIVDVRIVEPGAVVQAQTPIYTIALTNPVWVRTYVSETNLGKVHPGMKATVTTDSAPGKIYRGQVGFISPVAEFTPKTVQTPELRTSLVYRMRVIVQNPDQGLRQGMPVTVHLALDGAVSGKQDEGTGH